MNFKRRGPMLLILATIVVVAGISLLAGFLTTSLLQSSHDGDFALMRNVLDSNLKLAKDDALEAAHVVISMPSVRAAFRDRDRPKLLAECQEMFKVESEKYGVDVAEFQVPPGVAFLRLHRPDKFGDDETGYHAMLVDVHHSKALRQGIIIGKSGPEVSAVVPVLDEGARFVGSFEMGLDLGPMLDEIKNTFEVEGALFIDEKALHGIATEVPAETMSAKNHVGRFIRFHATHPMLMSALVLDGDVDVTTSRSYERSVTGTPWGVQLVPLYDYNNKQIGVFALARNFGADKAAAGRARVWQGLAALFGVVLLSGMILIVIRGFLLAPLASLSRRFRALADGEEAPPADPADDVCDELRALSASYEKLRARRGS